MQAAKIGRMLAAADALHSKQHSTAQPCSPPNKHTSSTCIRLATRRLDLPWTCYWSTFLAVAHAGMLHCGRLTHAAVRRALLASTEWGPVMFDQGQICRQLHRQTKVRKPMRRKAPNVSQTTGRPCRCITDAVLASCMHQAQQTRS